MGFAVCSWNQKRSVEHLQQKIPDGFNPKYNFTETKEVFGADYLEKAQKTFADKQKYCDEDVVDEPKYDVTRLLTGRLGCPVRKARAFPFP